MKDGYTIDPLGKKQRVTGLDTLAELARAGAIHAGTLVQDEATGKMFLAENHPFLKGKCIPAPATASNPLATPPPAPRPSGPAAGHAPQFSAPSVHAGGASQGNAFVSEEMVRQFVACNWWIFWGVLALFGFFTSIISIVFFIYAIIRKQGIRQRAAELGIDPDEIATAASARFWQTGGPILKVFGILAACLVGLFVFVGLIGAGCSPKPALESDYGSANNARYAR